jgi:hypothetical protein
MPPLVVIKKYQEMGQSKKLPRCTYPKASDKHLHGLQSLPKTIPSVDWEATETYRSNNFSALSLSELTKDEILETAKIVADSFALNEPVQRHLSVPKEMPKNLPDYIHSDIFGTEHFGGWTKPNIIYWIIRLFVLTNPSDPIGKIEINPDLEKFSLAILNKDSSVIGGAFNSVVHIEENTNREPDPFMRACFMFNKPVFELIFPQEHEAIKALKSTYPNFRLALENHKVGSHFLVAGSPELPSEDTFELVAASAQTFKEQGFEYMIVGAVNEWTGAACEVLNGTRVHFVPYRAEQRVPTTKEALPTDRYSEDGFLSDKDSGSMFYVIKLNA